MTPRPVGLGLDFDAAASHQNPKASRPPRRNPVRRTRCVHQQREEKVVEVIKTLDRYIRVNQSDVFGSVVLPSTAPLRRKPVPSPDDDELGTRQIFR